MWRDRVYLLHIVGSVLWVLDLLPAVGQLCGENETEVRLRAAASWDNQAARRAGSSQHAAGLYVHLHLYQNLLFVTRSLGSYTKPGRGGGGRGIRRECGLVMAILKIMAFLRQQCVCEWNLECVFNPVTNTRGERERFTQEGTVELPFQR